MSPSTRRVRRHAASREIGRFDRIVVLVNSASTIVVGLGTVALTIVSIRLTSDFNGWQQSWAATQAADQKKGEIAEAADRLKDRCIEIAKLGTELARTVDVSQAGAILSLVAGWDKRCTAVGPGAEAISAAIVVKQARKFDDLTVAKAIRIVDQTAEHRQALGSTILATEATSETFDPSRTRSNAESIIEDAVDGRAYSSIESIESTQNAMPQSSEPVSVSWNSPMGPIRFDFAKILKKEDYDRTETFRFSTATRF